MQNVLSLVLASVHFRTQETSTYVAELIPVNVQKPNRETATSMAAKVLLQQAFREESQGRHTALAAPGVFL